MSKFADAPRSRAPAAHVVLTPDDFIDEWPLRPKGEVAIGLRRVCADDWFTARSIAARRALGAHGDEDGDILDRVSYVEAFNDGVREYAVARGTCDVNDVTKPYFEMAEDTVRQALHPRAIRKVWDRLERLHVESTVLVKPATDDDLAWLRARLTPKYLTTVGSKRVALARKLLAYVVTEMREAEQAGNDVDLAAMGVALSGD